MPSNTAPRPSLLEQKIRSPETVSLLHHYRLHPDTVLDVADHLDALDTPADAGRVAAQLGIQRRTAGYAIDVLTHVGFLSPSPAT